MSQAKSVMVVEVTAPAWLHRFIIGKKGQNIGRITQQLPRVRRRRLTFDLFTQREGPDSGLTSVCVCVCVRQVHIEFTDGEERISLEGPTEEVEQAQTQIQEIIKDLVRRPRGGVWISAFTVVVESHFF